MDDRTPPSAALIEKSVFGSFLLYREIFLKYSHMLIPDFFYNSAYKKIFEYMVAESCNIPRILKEKFPQYQAEITDALAAQDGSTNYSAEFDILKDRYERRRLIEISLAAIDGAHSDFESKASEIIDATISKINESYIAAGTPEHIKKILPRVITMLENQIRGEAPGASTGLIDVDKILGCFMPGEMSIIAGRPSMGKTSFVNEIVRFMAIRQEKPVLFFSLEMTKEQIAGRILFSESKASYGSALLGHRKSLEAVMSNIDIVQTAGIWIDDTAGTTVSNIMTKAENYVKNHGVQVIFVDHCGYIRPTHRARTKHDEISEISKSLCAVAKKLNIPVVLVSQLSREVERRSPPIPQLSDLRESGSLEEDARKVILLYRDDYYKRDSNRKGILDVIIAKNHNGPSGRVEVLYDLPTMSFKNLEKESGDDAKSWND